MPNTNRRSPRMLVSSAGTSNLMSTSALTDSVRSTADPVASDLMTPSPRRHSTYANDPVSSSGLIKAGMSTRRVLASTIENDGELDDEPVEAEEEIVVGDSEGEGSALIEPTQPQSRLSQPRRVAEVEEVSRLCTSSALDQAGPFIPYQHRLQSWPSTISLDVDQMKARESMEKQNSKKRQSSSNLSITSKAMAPKPRSSRKNAVPDSEESSHDEADLLQKGRETSSSTYKRTAPFCEDALDASAICAGAASDKTSLISTGKSMIKDRRSPRVPKDARITGASSLSKKSACAREADEDDEQHEDENDEPARSLTGLRRTAEENRAVEPVRASSLPKEPRSSQASDPIDLAPVVSPAKRPSTTNPNGRPPKKPARQSKAPNARGLAGILQRKGIAGARMPGLSRVSKVPSLHTNLKPPPPQKAALPKVKQKKKKGDESYSDEEKPWYEKKHPEEWDDEDHYRWKKICERRERGIASDDE